MLKMIAREFILPFTDLERPKRSTARYLTVVVEGKKNEDAAWYYPEPKHAAAEIRGRVAFWKGVRVE